MDIRQAIFQRLHACSSSELKEIIESGIASKEETSYPGLVFFLKLIIISLKLQKIELLCTVLSHL